jgi:hypothetical protein
MGLEELGFNVLVPAAVLLAGFLALFVKTALPSPPALPPKR